MTKLATIEQVERVYQHPNADKLEFVNVGGYSCIVPRDKYSVGDLCILIQPDTTLPEVEWSEFYRKASKNRVKASKIRGEWSFGIVESISLLGSDYTGTLDIGTEVSDYLKVIKYEAPQPQDLSAKGGLPFSIPKTDQERYQNMRLHKLYGKKVNITLKVDGQSFTCYWKDGIFGVCGRTLEIKLDSQNRYTDHISRYNLQEKLSRYCTKHNVNIALRGESYGQGIQNFSCNPHSKLPHGLMFFGVWLIDKMKYAYKGHKHSVENVCRELDLPLVPMIERDVELTPELIAKYASGIEKLNNNYFEGVVFDTGDETFKVINMTYDSKK